MSPATSLLQSIQIPFVRASTAGQPRTVDEEAATLEPNEPRGGVAANSGFELDEHAFMAEIEPVPAFLTRPIVDEIEALLELARAEEWPAKPALRRTG